MCVRVVGRSVVESARMSHIIGDPWQRTWGSAMAALSAYMVPKSAPKMVQRWSKHSDVSQIGQVVDLVNKGFQDGPKMVRTWSETGRLTYGPDAKCDGGNRVSKS